MFVILSISDSDKHFASAIGEYTKRLGKQIFFDTLKPFKDTNRALVIQRETEQIVSVIQKKYTEYKKILLIKEWTSFSTEALQKEISHQNCVFIIWWPYGVDRELFKNQIWDLKEISFGGITLPHGLAKLVLIEQLYRCSTIDIWKNYHY